MTTSRITLGLAAALFAFPAGAQSQPDIDDAYLEPQPDPARLVLERAVRDVVGAQPARAAAALSLAASQAGVALDGEDPHAVLLRLASALAVPGGAAQLPERCPPEAPGTLRCALDRAVRAIAAGNLPAARAELDAGAAGATLAPTHPITLLLRVTSGLEARRPPAPASPFRARPMPSPFLGGALQAPAPSRVFLRDPELRLRPTQGMSGVETVALYSTAVLWGGSFGLYLATSAVRADAGAHTVLFPLLGIGAGVAAAFVIDHSAEVRRGRALAVQAGMWLGLTAGIGIVGAANLSFDRDEVNLGSHTLFLSSTAGMILGAGLAAATDARPGSVSFTFSTGFWGAYAGAMVESVVRLSARRSSRFPAAGILVGEGLGVATGLIFSKLIEPTAAQSRWMDLGALTGASVGVLLGSLAANSRDTETMPFVGSLVGLAGGMALGYVLGRPSPEERRMNRERDGETGLHPRAFVAPVQGGAVAGLSL
ncbi:MAG: hypothetical protein R3A48_15295 [Polyangiales bacterium]